MVKIGKAFFDEDFRWGVVPNMGYDNADKYLVILQNGVKVSVAASDAMVQAAMEGIGYDAGLEPRLYEMLDADEMIELSPLLEQGYIWIAKDKRGLSYAFRNEPELSGAYWEDPQEGPSSRLFCDYAFLGEGEKQNLAPLLERGEADE